jgi:hypothetical protein
MIHESNNNKSSLKKRQLYFPQFGDLLKEWEKITNTEIRMWKDST